MRYGRVLMTIVCFITMFSLLACTTANTGKKKNEESNEIPEKYIGKNKFLEFDTEIVNTKRGNNIYKSTAVATKFNAETVVPIMFGEGVESELVEGDRDNYIHSNGNSFYVYKNYLAFNSNSQLQTCVMKSFSLFDENYTADKFESVEAHHASVDLNLKQQIIDTCSSMGIENMNLYKMYKLNYKTLQENEHHEDKMGNDMPYKYKKDWSEADNSIYWIGNQTWQELPVFCSAYSESITDTWAPIQVLQTQNGIEKIQVLYDFKFEKSSEQVKLRAFEEVANALTKEYSMLLTDNKYVATKAELHYWVDVNQEDTKFDMIPVWVFTVKEYKSNTEDEYVEYQKLVNAETAEILEVGE